MCKNYPHFTPYDKKEVKCLYKLRYKTTTRINDHSNYAHCGSLILARSKSIMYRITSTDMTDPHILYTDTDSIILPKKTYAIIKKYPGLIGSDMCQFHSELFWNGASTAVITAKRAIFIDKKIYILELSNDEIPNEVQYHIRMKGISTDMVKLHAEKDNITPFELYERIIENGYTFLVNNISRKIGPF